MAEGNSRSKGSCIAQTRDIPAMATGHGLLRLKRATGAFAPLLASGVVLKRYEDGLVHFRGSDEPHAKSVHEDQLLGLARTFLRKEVIQPQVPLRLPCYDFTPVAEPTVVGCPLLPGWRTTFG